MERARTSGRMVAAERRTDRVHTGWLSSKQRFHFAALLICLFVLPLQAQSDIGFDPSITEEEFADFSRRVAQAIYATPVEPARARGLLGFDIGVAVTAMPVDTEAAYWTRSVRDDFTVSDYVAVPRLVASKGFAIGTVSASYSRIPDTEISVWGGSVDLPIIRGGIATPELAVRGAYAQLQGVENFDLKTYGLELFLSKGFGPVTPYLAAGRARSDAAARSAIPEFIHDDQFDTNRFTAGVRVSLLLAKLAVEATQAEERSYAAKLSFGF